MAKRPTTSKAAKSSTKRAGKKPDAQKRARSRSPRQRRPAAGEADNSDSSIANADVVMASPAAAPLADKPKDKGGRPPISPELLERVLERIADGEYLEEVCRDPDMPSATTVKKYKRQDAKFASAYARAREDQMESLEFQAMTTARDGSRDWKEVKNQDGSTKLVPDHEVIGRSRLIVEQIRWNMTKIFPALYGDRVAVDVNPATPLETILNKAKQRAREQGFIVVESEDGDGKAETAH